MFQNYPQPRWGILYLTLPLAGGLFELIQRMRPAGTFRTLADVGALLIVGAFVEAWRLANRVAMLHHPLPGHDGEPIYYAREGTVSSPAAPGKSVRAVFVTDAYGDLFSLLRDCDSQETEDDVDKFPQPAARPGSAAG